MSDDAFDIFISYARKDRERVDLIWDRLTAQHWTTWRDDHIPTGAEFEPEILERLNEARCVVVVWSKESVERDWVLREAALARDCGKLFPVQIDDCRLPDAFAGINARQLQSWSGELNHAAFKQLLLDLAERIGPKKPVGTFPRQQPFEPVSDKHLALVHSSWKWADKENKFPGQTMYRIHVILIGRSGVLDQVESVIYHLDPSYPTYTYVCTADDRPRNFELKELADGYSVIRASVKIKGQAKLVELSHFINLSATGPRLDSDFVGKHLWYEDE